MCPALFSGLKKKKKTDRLDDPLLVGPPPRRRVPVSNETSNAKTSPPEPLSDPMTTPSYSEVPHLYQPLPQDRNPAVIHGGTHYQPTEPKASQLPLRLQTEAPFGSHAILHE